MRGLKICLWLAGLFCLSAIAVVFVSRSAMESFIRCCNMPPLPDSPLFFYIVRLLSATYVAIGIFFIILALRPRSFGGMIPFAGWASFILGLFIALMGYRVGMPLWWFLGDSLPCIVLGILILAFWRRVRHSADSDSSLPTLLTK